MNKNQFFYGNNKQIHFISFNFYMKDTHTQYVYWFLLSFHITVFIRLGVLDFLVILSCMKLGRLTQFSRWSTWRQFGGSLPNRASDSPERHSTRWISIMTMTNNVIWSIFLNILEAILYYNLTVWLFRYDYCIYYTEIAL